MNNFTAFLELLSVPPKRTD